MPAEKPRKLTERQQKFIEEFLLCGNASEAARKAGYSAKTANREGSRLLSNVDIQAALKAHYDRRKSEFEVSEKRLMHQLAAVAFFDIFDLFETNEHGQIVLKKIEDIPKNARLAVENFAPTPDGWRVKAHSKISAIQLLGTHIGMFKDARPADDSANRKAVLDRLRNYIARRNGSGGDGGST